MLSPVEAALFTVCSSGCNSTTVQGGINLASNFDEVRIIDTREYNENVSVNKSITLTSNVSTPTIWANQTLPAINVTANNATINNINVKYNGTTSNVNAIEAINILNITMSNNTISTIGSSSNRAIYFTLTNSSSITNNTLSTNGTSTSNVGIYIDTGTDIKIQSNTISTTGTSGNHGIYLISVSKSILINNTISTNGTSGLSFGIFLDSNANNNTILTNTISTNGSSGANYGILSQAGSNNIFTNNTISTNGTSSENHGIVLSTSSNNNTFKNMNVTTNTTLSYGINIDTSGDNTFYDSIINAITANDIFLVGTAANNNYVINSTFNKSDINVSASTVQTKLFNQYYLDVNVKDQSNYAINSATVSGRDNQLYSSTNPTSSFTALTDSSGNIQRRTLTEFMANGTYNLTSGYLYFTNYQITATKDSKSSSQSVDLNDNKFLTFTLDLSQPIAPPPINIPPPSNPTIFPTTEIPIPPPETTFDLPTSGITIRLDPKLVITLYPLTKKKATIHNISQIEPSRYKILLCNQTEIASYEINVTADLAYFCANYSGYPVEDPTVSIFRFSQDDWALFSQDKIIRNTTSKIICGQISATPYLVAGFQLNPDSKSALQIIKEANNTIELARRQNISTEDAESLLSQAVNNYYSCNYITANALANRALSALVAIPSIPIYVPITIGSVITIAVVWYLFLRAKVRVKIKEKIA